MCYDSVLQNLFIILLIFQQMITWKADHLYQSNKLAGTNFATTNLGKLYDCFDVCLMYKITECIDDKYQIMRSCQSK